MMKGFILASAATAATAAISNSQGSIVVVSPRGRPLSANVLSQGIGDTSPRMMQLKSSTDEQNLRTDEDPKWAIGYESPAWCESYVCAEHPQKDKTCIDQTFIPSSLIQVLPAGSAEIDTFREASSAELCLSRHIQTQEQAEEYLREHWPKLEIYAGSKYQVQDLYMFAYLYATSYLLTATDPLNIPAPIISERGWLLVSFYYLID